jgi:hypothetical protein
MPKFAKEIVVERGSIVRLLVDGKEFPWYVGIPITTQVSREAMPSIMLELFADRVRILDDVSPKPRPLGWRGRILGAVRLGARKALTFEA